MLRYIYITAWGKFSPTKIIAKMLTLREQKIVSSLDLAHAKLINEYPTMASVAKTALAAASDFPTLNEAGDTCCVTFTNDGINYTYIVRIFDNHCANCGAVYRTELL
jgi:hypothetical protein